jgi:predicted 3-demethylubiquinone-9 3-methyltransferase (glyoxalase superfamily)
MTQKITPFLWFDNQADSAIKFYTSLFKNSKINHIRRYPDEGLEGPMKGMEGKVITGEFELEGQRFLALDGGPAFKFTPAISFYVNCESEAEIDQLWASLSEGGMALMPLDKYDFSEKFGWLMDKYGLTWQLNLGARAQKITPFLMFVGKQHGKAEEAINFYTSLFKNSKIEHIERYGAGEDSPGTVKHATFQLAGQDFMAIDSSYAHDFTFTEAISFYVECGPQEEVDHFWNKLSADPSAEQCGWLKDKFGVSWQIIPTALPELMSDPDPKKSRRVMEAMLQMKKIDIASLKKAYEG